MSAQFQGPLVDPANGQVRILIQPSAVRPGDAIDFRGLAISPSAHVYCLTDTGQPRVFANGLPLEASTGLLLVSVKAVANISMGGLGIDADGAIPYKISLPTVIHQGVGLDSVGTLHVEMAG